MTLVKQVKVFSLFLYMVLAIDIANKFGLSARIVNLYVSILSGIASLNLMLGTHFYNTSCLAIITV